MKKEYKRWGINELAFLRYGRYKGLTNRQLAQLADSSEAAVQQQLYKMNSPERSSKKYQKMYERAAVLEMAVRSGQYPDHREKWDKQISRINGIRYEYTPAVEAAVEKEEVVVENLPPLLKLEINTAMLIKVIKAWKHA